MQENVSYSLQFVLFFFFAQGPVEIESRDFSSVFNGNENDYPGPRGFLLILSFFQICQERIKESLWDQGRK